MKIRLLIPAAIVLIAAAPAFASHEDPDGKERCDGWHSTPHYGLTRTDPNDPASWPAQGDPDRPWVGSTSETAAVYAGMNGGSEGNAAVAAGACGETGNGGGAQSNGGTTEVAIYQDGTDVDVVVVGEGGGDDPNNDAYAGLNTGYDKPNGRANRGGPLCVGTGGGVCTPADTPVMCEKPTNLGGGSANWHNTSADGCDLRMQ